MSTASTSTGAGAALRRQLTRVTFNSMLRQQWKSRFIEPIRRWNIVTGDKVKIMSGRGNGYIGTVKQVLRHKNSVVVSGAKLTKRIAKRNEMSSGYIYMSESTIHVSNVMLIDLLYYNMLYDVYEHVH